MRILKHTLRIIAAPAIAILCGVFLDLFNSGLSRYLGFILGFVVLVIWLGVRRFDIYFHREWTWERSKIGLARDNPGYFLKLLRNFFIVFYMVSPSKWISGTRRHEHAINLERDLTPYTHIDIYVTLWLFIELLIAVPLFLCHHQGALPFWIIALFSYRLFDIFQSWVKQFILTNNWNAVNVNRSLVLAFIGYIEITVIGAVIRFPCERSKAFYSSVNTMIANPGVNASPIQYTQIMFAVLFAAVVVQHVVGKLTSKE